MDGLAYVGKIIEVEIIEGADFVDAYTVVCGPGGKWHGVSQKGLEVGNLVEVYLPDCIVPSEERFSFMQKYKYRVTPKRFKGVPSECLIMPLTVKGDVGDDITHLIGCKKYEKPISVTLQGDIYSDFPYFIPKTDELNFQKVPNFVEALIGKPFYSTIKIDGTSSTFYRRDNHFGVCSRNKEYKPHDENTFWRIARKYNLENCWPEGFALQGEVAGPSIQRNKIKLKKIDLFVFDVYCIEERRYMNYHERLTFLRKINSELNLVPLLECDVVFSEEHAYDLNKYAEKKYNDCWVEGVVIRPMVEETVDNERLSFKVLNLLYKQ